MNRIPCNPVPNGQPCRKEMGRNWPSIAKEQNAFKYLGKNKDAPCIRPKGLDNSCPSRSLHSHHPSSNERDLHNLRLSGAHYILSWDFAFQHEDHRIEFHSHPLPQTYERVRWRVEEEFRLEVLISDLIRHAFDIQSLILGLQLFKIKFVPLVCPESCPRKLQG